jgi:DNA adenine methylase
MAGAFLVRPDWCSAVAVLSATSPQPSGFELQLVGRPFLRWAGGKTRLLRHLRPLFPEQFVDYYEPFLGGGAVFFDAGHRANGVVVLADLNDELINVWRLVRDEPLELLDALAAYDGKDTEDAYYAVRDGDVPTAAVELAARFLYLNQTAWNGLWRVNRWGRFNVPWGARPFRGIPEAELVRISGLLADADIRVADFRDVLAEPSEGDFVYLDPPYLPISDTSKFHGYTEKRFRRPDLVELGDICRELTARGVHWILSNRDTPLVRDVFEDAQIVALTARRSVAAQNRRDVEPSESPEVIIVGTY